MKNIFAKKTINVGRSLGKILTFARKKKNITLEKAELDTKVRLKYLKLLENDDYTNMPADVYNIGFLTRYIEYLGLNKENCLTKYYAEKNLNKQLEKKKFYLIREKQNFINPGNPAQFRDKLKFVITPQIFVTAFIIFIVLGILGYIWFQVKSFAAAPPLELNNPAEQIIVSSNTIDVTGKTDPNANLIINNQSVAIDEMGNFKQTIKLDKGVNTIEIKAENKANRQTIKNIKVLVISGDTKGATDEKEY